MSTVRELNYKRVFVSLDGSDCQDDVFARAIQIACRNNAELFIGHVIDTTTLETAGIYPSKLLEALESSFRNSIAPQLKIAEKEEHIPRVEVIVRSGRIRETLKDEMLDQINPDLVVCGARGLSPIKYALLGSISTFLLRNADCDILVVK